MTELQRIARSTLQAAVAAALIAGFGTAVHADPSAPPAQAEQQPYQAPAPAPAQADEPVSDEQLEKFASAASEIMEVQQNYASEMQAAPDAEEVQTLQEKAQEEMTGIVDEHGLSVGEYNMIAQRLQTDPDLIKRINELQ